MLGHSRLYILIRSRFKGTMYMLAHVSAGIPHIHSYQLWYYYSAVLQMSKRCNKLSEALLLTCLCLECSYTLLSRDDSKK